MNLAISRSWRNGFLALARDQRKGNGMEATNGIFLASGYAIQLLGLATVILARLVPAGTLQRRAQVAFVGTLVVTGAATMLAVSIGSEHWHSLGVTLSIMLIGAVVDLNRGGLNSAAVPTV
jgi:hypothetical protein